MFRSLWILVVTVSLAATVLLASQFLEPGTLLALSTLAFAVVPVGAGALLVMAALKNRGPGSLGWSLIGAGVCSWGLGELTWHYYSIVLGVEVPYPGLADLFYLGAYPVILTGVVMLPYLHPRKWERGRLSLDALAATVGLGAITWTFLLKDVIYIDGEIGILENVVNLSYPIGDLLLLAAVMVLITRRSQLLFDGRLLVLGLGLAVTAFADMAYVFQVDAGTYFDGGRLDALWLGAYGLFAVTALLVAGPTKFREPADGRGRIAPMIALYGAIGALFALTLGEVGVRTSALQVASGFVGLWVIARQAIAIRETRQVVEKQRNDLVASISHELRTPLTAIAGFADILDQDANLAPDMRAEMTSLVNSQTKHLARIVGDLVEVSRSRLDRASLTYSTIDVDSLIESAIAMLLSDGAREAITLHVQPGLTVTGDVNRLRQVLVNFLTNAHRYGGGTVEVHARTTDGARTVFEVHDDGPGIPKKYETTIWDRFERGPHTYLSGIQGSGLGLPIARQLIAAHHGHTGHHPSPLLGGACFWFTLPDEGLQVRRANLPITSFRATGSRHRSVTRHHPPVRSGR